MIKEMRKVQIIGPKSTLDGSIRLLHDLSAVHIETVLPEKAHLERLPLESEKARRKDFLEKALERIKNILQLMPPTPQGPERVAPEDIERLLHDSTPVAKKAATLRSRIDALKEELSVVTRYEKLLKGFAPVISRMGGLKNFEITGLTLERTREDVVTLITSEMQRITEGMFEAHSMSLDERTAGLVLTYPKRFSNEVRPLLSGKSISEIRLPDEYQEMPLLGALKQMVIKREELPRLIWLAESELGGLAEAWRARLAGLKEAIESELEEIGVVAYAAQTRYAFVIEGWVPADGCERLKKGFAETFSDKVVVRELEIREEDEEGVPVCIYNPRAIRPFEVFLSALPPPKYGSVDPTPFVAVFFPAFFGLIVGDVGYGAIILALSLYLRRRAGSGTLKDMATVLAVSSVSAIIVGFLFGEFFGDLGALLGLHPLLVHRTEALKSLLFFTIGIGVGHVLLGISISIVNNIQRRRSKEAWARISYLTVIVSFLLILGAGFDYVPKWAVTPGVLVLVISLAALTVIEGILGPLEFVKALGNMLSYVRIMAIGTASVVMALVANKIGGVAEGASLGIIAAAIIHLLNTVMSILSPSIQSMRLQYVEFFSTFYQGGGRRYLPFSKR